MAPDPDPPPDPTPPPATLNADELRDTIGDEVDARMEARGLTIDRLQKLDILDSFGTTIEELFTKHTPQGGSTVDKEGLLSELGTLIDTKLKAFKPSAEGTTTTTTDARRRGPLGRFLFPDASGS